MPPTDVPVARRCDPDVLTADVNALHRALGGDRRAVVIGHGWGAIGAARAAAAAPERWRRVVTLGVPPERVLHRAWHGQRRLSALPYGVVAQVPVLGERWFGDPRRLESLWRRWSPGYEPTPADLEPVRAAVAEPAVRRALLAIHRGTAAVTARGRSFGARASLPPQPHLVVHGADDGAFDVADARAAIGRLPHPASQVEVVAGVGHWPHLEAPEPVGWRIVAFVTADQSG